MCHSQSMQMPLAHKQVMHVFDSFASAVNPSVESNLACIVRTLLATSCDHGVSASITCDHYECTGTVTAYTQL